MTTLDNCLHCGKEISKDDQAIASCNGAYDVLYCDGECQTAHEQLTGEGSKLMERGRYVDFWELPNGNLRMVLNRANEKDFREDILRVAKERGIDYAIMDMIEDYTQNGWMIFRNEEIGALTDALIFGQDYEHYTEEDEGYDPSSDALKKVGRVYFNERYALDSEVEILLERGYYDFAYAD